MGVKYLGIFRKEVIICNNCWRESDYY